MINITLIICGEDVSVMVESDETLGAVRQRALLISHNTARRPEEWEIRTDGGVYLDPESTIGGFGILEGARLFLSPIIGAGGMS